MTGGFEVVYTAQARGDLARFIEFLLERAQTLEELDAAAEAVDAIERYVRQKLSHNPFLCRKAGQNPFRRELVIPFPGDGYVALVAIDAQPGEQKRGIVTVLALRHQREEDFLG